MKQCLSLFVSRGSGRSLTHANVVSLEFPIQRGAADPQHLPGTRLIALNLRKDTLNRVPFELFQIGIGSDCPRAWP